MEKLLGDDLRSVLNSNSTCESILPTRTDAVLTVSPSPILQRQFAEPKTDMEIAAARAQGVHVPLKTQQDTKYCLGLWQALRDHRKFTTGTNFASLIELNTSELQHWLTRLILEVRKKNGDEFPLHHMVCSI